MYKIPKEQSNFWLTPTCKDVLRSQAKLRNVSLSEAVATGVFLLVAETQKTQAARDRKAAKARREGGHA